MDKKIIVPKVGFEETIDILLTPERFPIAFKNKVDELMEERAFDTREEAEQWVKTTPICFELLYEKGQGLIGIESEAIEYCDLVSPYSGFPIVNENDN